jgi:ribonuclease T2
VAIFRTNRLFALLGLLTLATTACQPPAPQQDRQEARVAPKASRKAGPMRAEISAPAQFDFYLLNLSWSPEFCATHPGSPECARRLGFVVHGLWPQNDDGSYPQHCGQQPGPTNPQADTDIMPTVGLVEHEWQTHGTCTGLPADQYFAQMHTAYEAVQIPSGIGAGSDPQGVPPSQLLARFAAANPGYPADSFALSCGNNRLTAIEICLSKDLRPQSCRGVRSCRANVVKVTPP